MREVYTKVGQLGASGGPKGRDRSGHLLQASARQVWCPGYSYILSQIVPRMLLITYAIPLEALLRTDPPTRLVLSVLYVAAPVIFASVCFAARFKVRPAADLGG